MKVAKFGGSSLADSFQFEKVIDIVKSDLNRKVIIVSAPGRRSSCDTKITDLFYMWKSKARQGISCDEIYCTIIERYSEIVEGLGLKLDIKAEIDRIQHVIQNLKEGTSSYAASRGEYLSAKIMAEALGYDFVDAVECIRFNELGGSRLVEDDEHNIRELIGNRSVVIPGFYGCRLHCSNEIITFSRGGSDLTGAIIAGALKADVYENWTDVSGLLRCDPRIVSGPPVISSVTYRELRELAYMGAEVFHPEAMFPVQKAEVPTNIRNTNDPDNPGTLISSSLPHAGTRDVITGIAGRKGFTIITIEKALMNQEIGFARKVLSVLEDLDISFEHMPGGIDTLSIVIDQKILGERQDKLIRKIRDFVHCDRIRVSSNIAMIAIVGEHLFDDAQITSRIFCALTRLKIKCSLINQGSSELSMIIGVQDNRYEEAILSIYSEFLYQRSYK
jgi:aspartate kinase